SPPPPPVGVRARGSQLRRAAHDPTLCRRMVLYATGVVAYVAVSSNGERGSAIRVWNFQALEIPAFIGLGEFQTPFFGQSPGTRNFRNLRHEACGIRSCVIQSISANGGKTHGPQSNHHYPRP